jgi:hypothetical protein
MLPVVPLKKLLPIAALLVLAVAALQRGADEPLPEARIAATAPAAPRDRPAKRVRKRTAAAPKARAVAATSWGLRAVGAPGIWQWGSGSPATVVAVLDSGVDPSGRDLSIRPGWNVLTSSGDTRDDNGHGTQVAGVIAGRASGPRGVGGYCVRCTILPVKVLDRDGRGSGADIASGIVWAVDHGARVVNLSFVLDAADPGVTKAIDYATDHGVVVVAATGNGGGTEPRYPAADPRVISIAAATAAGQLYPWSVTGPWVTAAAPGCNASTGLGGQSVEFCGTSSAAAAASGLIALALSDAPGVAVTALRAAVATTGSSPALIDGMALLRRLRAAQR